MRRITSLALAALSLAAAGVLLEACGGESSPTTSTGGATSSGAETAPSGDADQRFPELVEAEASSAGDGLYDFDVTISSPYDTPERYADGWRVLGPDGEVLGEMELLHDHASEQPFTRTQTGVEIPEGVDEVQIEGHDLANGYGGEKLTVQL